MLGVLKSIAGELVHTFVDIGMQAVKDWITGTDGLLGGLVSKVKGALSGLFDGAAGAASSVAGGASSAAGGASSAAGGAASAASGAMGAVNMVSGLVSAGADIAGAIGTFRLEGTMNQVERNTAAGSIHLLHILEQINKHIPGISLIHESLYDYYGYFGELMTTVENLRDISRDYFTFAMNPANAQTAGGPPLTLNFHDSIISSEEVINRLAERITDEIRNATRG
jgi:hypothetical protein